MVTSCHLTLRVHKRVYTQLTTIYQLNTDKMLSLCIKHDAGAHDSRDARN